MSELFYQFPYSKKNVVDRLVREYLYYFEYLIIYFVSEIKNL